jgi:RNA polymerase sigma factor for flagellar operon FliA
LEEKKLWDKYIKNKTIDCRNDLVLYYLPLVRKIVNMTIGSYHLKEEFYNVGSIGLIDAIDKFSPDKNVKFETYASIRIRGSIKDFMRKQDWVSRTVREKEKLIEEKRTHLRTKFGREPEDIEVAKEAKIPIKEFIQIKSYLDNSNLASFENAVSEGMNPMNTREDEYNPEKILEKREMEKILAQEIKKLSIRNQQIISLYYREGLNLKEIGEVLEISESRVSQIMKKINDDLKSGIEKLIS